VVALFAFLHHVAASALVATLAVEFVLIKGELTIQSAKRLLITDAVFGVSAGVVLVVGLLRVFYFEKGAYYYFHSVPFIAKISFFAIIGLLSIYPTVTFLSWRSSLSQGVSPTIGAAKISAIRRIIHWELVCVVLILLCAALMARGIGYVWDWARASSATVAPSGPALNVDVHGMDFRRRADRRPGRFARGH
jgi:putative membrane protein